jgi:hypothetical protein
MKRMNLIAGAMLLFSVLACVMPGAGQPAPLDPGMLPTMVVLTANAAMTQTAAVVPPPPLETPTPTLAPTEAFTATPKISLAGTSLILREDQSAVFIDHKAGIELEIPAGWMAVRINEEEFYNAFTSAAAADAAIRDRLARLQTLDSSWFRLDAIDIRPGHVYNGAASDINVIFQENDSRSFEEIAESENAQPLANFEVISSGYQRTANGMETLVMEHKWDVTTGTAYYKGVFFKIPSGLLVLDFYSPLDFKDTVLPDFEKVVNSVALIDP